MKKLSLLFLTLFLLMSCGSSNQRSMTTSSTKKVRAIPGEVSLLNIIRKLHGVTVRGSGANSSIRVISGGNSFGNSSAPLFLVNGVAYGNDFSNLQNTINPAEVKSVEVYKTPAELARYGARGLNGVINIILK